MKPRDAVAWIGAGPVGLMSIMSAQLFGPARVFAIDMVDSRLEPAQGLGAVPINAGQTPAVYAVKAATGGFGVERSLEAVGDLAAIACSTQFLRGGALFSRVGSPNT